MFDTASNDSDGTAETLKFKCQKESKCESICHVQQQKDRRVSQTVGRGEHGGGSHVTYRQEHQSLSAWPAYTCLGIWTEGHLHYQHKVQIMHESYK